MSSPHDNKSTATKEQVGLEQVREARQFHQLLSGAEEVARGDLWEIVETLTRQVDELRNSRPLLGSGNRQMESDVRWLDARVVLLEQALSDSRTEVATLRDYIDAYAAEMRLEIRDAAATAKAERQQLIDELRDLAASNAELETVLAQLRSESADRIEGVAAELFEVADRTRHIAADAHITASTAAGRSEGLLDEIYDNVEKVQALAEQAQAQSAEDIRGIAEEAQAVAQRSTDAVDEVRAVAEDAHEAVRLSLEATEGVFAIADEARIKASTNSKAVAELREITEDTSTAVAESNEAAEEVRVMAEKAKDLAERSANDVAALQADADALNEIHDFDLAELSKEIARLKADIKAASEDLHEGWEQVSADVDAKVQAATGKVSEQLRSEVNNSTEAMRHDLQEEASSLREETRALHSKVDSFAAGAPVPSDDIDEFKMQLTELRQRMQSLTVRSDRRTTDTPEPQRSTKRWVAHLDLTNTSKADLRALPSAEDEDVRK